ncbi:MAG TPA: AsmA family protein [Gammaproteobacteria bacterium]|nr:AsmA family protein [Gammaproteobacteria bacterium]
MRFLRILVAILGLLVIVGIFIMGSLIFFVDPNQLKPTIINEVMKQTGYRLHIDGNLSWSFYPRLGIKIQHMTVGLPNQLDPLIDLRDVRMTTLLSTLFNRNQALQGAIYIAEMRSANVHLQNTRIGLEWKNNVLSLSPVTASLYAGSLSGIAHGSQLSATPLWDWDIRLNHIQLQSLFQDLNSNHKIKLSGIGTITIQATTAGKNNNQLLKNLNGVTTFNVDKGLLQGIDLNYLVQSADALLNKQPLSIPPKDNQTLFNQMTGSAVIKNGMAISNDLLLTSSAFTTKGSGSINLVDQTLDYQLQVTPLQMTKIKWAVPILMTGSLQNPSIRLDTLKLNVLVTQDQFEKIKSKIQKEVKQLPDKVDKFLQRLMDN